MRGLVAFLLLASLTACSGSGSSDPVGEAPEPTPAPLARDCTWLFNADPDLFNVFFPDTAAQYWIGVVAIPPGGEVKVEGEYPIARYMSFNLYGPTLGPIDARADVQIAPDPGSVNPYALGADRYASARRYSLRIVADPAPENAADRAPNTLYAGINGVTVNAAVIAYRIYVADRGTSLAGNADLPRFKYVLANGSELPAPEACDFLERTRLGAGLNELLLTINLSAVPVNFPQAFDPPLFRRFFNAPLTLFQALASPLNFLPVYEPIRHLLYGSGLSGGLLSNEDNRYVAASINNTLGELLVLTSKMPTTPRTHDNVATMQGGELRYLSLCSVDTPTQRYWGCIYDEQIPRDADGQYVVIVSHQSDRPANARPECGIAWVDWGPLQSSALILRHMLPDPGFPYTVDNVVELDTEREVLGEYYPFGAYMTRAEIEALSADPGGDAASCQVDAAALRARTQR
jgi:hypothetical protein